MVKKCTLAMNAPHARLLEEERRREERIKLTIAKGKQTVLPTQTKSIKLSKFEHCSPEGPLVVFAEELAYPFGCFGKYQAIRKYQSGYDIGKDYCKKKTRAKGCSSRELMLNGEKSENIANRFDEKPSVEKQTLNKEMPETSIKLPKLKSGPTSTEVIEDTAAKLEFSGKNTELPKLPAQEYIDNFRRGAAEFERSLVGIGRGNAEGRLLKWKPREHSLLPRIDERISLPTTNAERFLSKDEHFRLPKLHQKRDGSSLELQSRRKRKTRNSSETKRPNFKRSMSHSERKPAAQKEQAKWCKMTFQSNTYT